MDIQFLLNTFLEIHSILFLLSEMDNLVEEATEDIQDDKEVNDFLVSLVEVLYNHHDDILVTKAVMDRGSKDHPFPYEAEQKAGVAERNGRRARYPKKRPTSATGARRQKSGGNFIERR